MWIEIFVDILVLPSNLSRPARALWIEIGSALNRKDHICVEAREGLVD